MTVDPPGRRHIFLDPVVRRLLLVAFFATALTAQAVAAPLKILALGDSLIHGYGLPAGETFPEQLEAALKAEGHDVVVLNAGNSGDTTAAGLARLDWALADKPDLVLVEFGGNDGLRGIDPADTRANMDAMIARLTAEGLPVLLVGALPSDGYRVFEPITGPGEQVAGPTGEWVAARQPIVGIVHGDPRNEQIAEITRQLSAAASSFLVGGLTGSRGDMPQVAGRVTEGGLSGVFLAPELQIATGLTQGCSPIGPLRQVTAGEQAVIKEIDGRPALEVFKEDIGELLAQDLRRCAGYIFIGFPVAGSDTGDYLVRNLIGMNPDEGWLHVGAPVEPGQSILVCRRDHDSARKDLKRMLGELAERAGPSPKAGLYFSCVARGQHLFGGNSEELKLVRETIGDIPLAGFFANGEISNDRLYGYTGVLALFV